MKQTILALVLIAITLAAALVAATTLLDDDSATATAATTARTTTSISATQPVAVWPVVLSDYLTNPGIGWQHAPDNGDQLLPDTVLYPPRQEISWRMLNPAPDQYDWSALDTWRERAQAQGKQLSFRVYTMRGQPYGGHQLPTWVLEQGAVLLRSGEPDYSNCVYQAAWADFVDELRARYDGDPLIAYIDISGYGNFNEWSWRDDQTTWDEDALDPASLDGLARRRLADMFIGGDNDEHECRLAGGEIETVEYDYPGFQSTQLVMPYAGVRQSTQYVISRRDDVGFRFDCLANASLTSNLRDKISDEIADLWRSAPVVFEFCANTTTERRFMTEAASLLAFAHGSLVHDNLLDPRETTPLAALLKLTGYRFVLDHVTYPSALTPGQPSSVTMTWHNAGSAPVYPRMGQDFTLALSLADAAGSSVFEAALPADIADWMPAEDLTDLASRPPMYDVNAALTLPASGTLDAVPPGSYTLRVGIRDERTGQLINLAIVGRDAAGWYPLGPVQVGG